MEWIGENWVWLLFGGAMIGMHLFGHGKRGGGGCCGGKRARETDQASQSEGSSTVER